MAGKRRKIGASKSGNDDVTTKNGEDAHQEEAVGESQKVKKRGRMPKSVAKTEEVPQSDTTDEELKHEMADSEQSDVKPKKRGRQLKEESKSDEDSEDLADHVEETDVKEKKRGRQPKNKPQKLSKMEKESNSNEEEEEGDEQGMEEKPKKRRVAKNVELDDGEKVGDMGAKPKKRVRANKVLIEKMEKADDEDDEVEPKKRGRAAKTAAKKKIEEGSSDIPEEDVDIKKRGRNEKTVDESIEPKSKAVARGKKANKQKVADKTVNELGKSNKELRIVLEHCSSWRVYHRHATAVHKALEENFPGISVLLNPGKPRRGSFEVVLQGHGDGDITLWSGIDKGPPRKLKFPDDPYELVQLLKHHFDFEHS